MEPRIDRHNWFAEYGDLLMRDLLVRDAQEPKYPWGSEEAQAFYQLAYNKEDNDCGVRALAVACAAPYEKAHWALQENGRLPGQPSFPAQMIAAANALRCHMVPTTCAAKTLRTVERELAKTHGGFIVTTCNHAVGIWNGELIDHARGRLWRVTEIYRIEPMRNAAQCERFDNQNRSK